MTDGNQDMSWAKLAATGTDVQVLGSVDTGDGNYPFVLVAIRGKFDRDELREIIESALTLAQ